MKGLAGWTLDTYAAHNEALREAERTFQDERDRRYAEVKSAEEKALAVKQRADDQALLLAREIQTYKDEKANELREQIGSERGTYATKTDLQALAEKYDVMHKPVVEFMATVQGRGVGLERGWAMVVGVALFVVSLIAIGSFVFVELRNAPQVTYAPTGQK